MGDPVLHVDLRDWADLLVVAPLSAHTLAKFAGGLCDDTLSCVFRAWWWPQPTHSATTPAAATGFSGSSRRIKPVVLAPAMNTGMWEHPITRRHLEEIKAFGGGGSTGSDVVRIVPPQVKTLACGETGDGALAAIPDIVQAVRASLGLAPSASRVLD
jgi:phosphopantothenoylcysteine decarboxylase